MCCFAIHGPHCTCGGENELALILLTAGAQSMCRPWVIQCSTLKALVTTSFLLLLVRHLLLLAWHLLLVASCYYYIHISIGARTLLGTKGIAARTGARTLQALTRDAPPRQLHDITNHHTAPCTTMSKHHTQTSQITTTTPLNNAHDHHLNMLLQAY